MPHNLTIYWKNKPKDTDFIDDIEKSPQLKCLIQYDENFNNKRKVMFESCLAGIIRTNPRKLYPSIVKVAKSLLPDFIDTFGKIKQAVNEKQEISWLLKNFYDYFAQNGDILAEYTGTFDKKINDSIEEFDNFTTWIGEILSSTNPQHAYKQLLIIAAYGHYFNRPYIHMPQFKHLNGGLGIQIVPEGVGDELSKLTMRELWEKCSLKVLRSDVPRSRISTSDTFRAKLISQFGIFDDKNIGNFTKLQKYLPEMSMHLPGKNLWRVIPVSPVAINAVYELDMPGIASQGGSIACLLIVGKVIGKLNPEELRYFNLNAISYMIGNGHHSLHEFKTAWEILEIPYVPGDYTSIFPEKLIENHPELLELQGEFPDLLSTKVPSNNEEDELKVPEEPKDRFDLT